jgi:predicted nucleic acid-binding protein
VPKRGRPPLPRGIVSFEHEDWAPPEALLLDTSVVVEALLPSEANHRACAGLFRRIADSKCTVIFNELLETELCEALFRLALKERHGRNWRAARYDGRVRRRAGRLLEAGMAGWQELLGPLPSVRFGLGEVNSDVSELMRRHGLGSYDAVHAASLFRAGIGDIATLDHGFTMLPQSLVSIHTTSARVPTMRRWRGGA